MRFDPDSLAQTCLTHLAREEESLQDSLAVLTRVREALLRSDAHELTALEVAQQRADAGAAQVRAERDRLRAYLADALGFSPQNVSFSTLIAALPPAHGAPLRRES